MFYGFTTPSPVGAHQFIELTDSAVETLTIPRGVTGIQMAATGEDILFTLTGDDPDIDGGHYLLQAGLLPLYLPFGRTKPIIKVIASTGTAKLQYNWTRY